MTIALRPNAETRVSRRESRASVQRQSVSIVIRGLIAVAIAAASMVVTVLPLSAQERYNLAEPVDDSRVFGVGAKLEVQGSVLTVGEKNETLKHPVKATAALSFRERRLVGLGVAAESLRAFREYEVTDAAIDIAGEVTKTSLGDALKLVVVQGRADGLQAYSLGGPLSSAEIDLLKFPGDPLSVVAILPQTDVEVGESWTPASWVLPMFVGLEATLKSELSGTLESVKNDLARIVVSGKLTGATGGSSSEVTVTAKLDYDLKNRNCLRLELNQKETRTVGPLSPGLDVEAKVLWVRKPAQIPGRVAEEPNLDRAIAAPSDSDWLVRCEPAWKTVLLHPRDWQLFHENDDLVILRLLRDGALLAQCNVSPAAMAKPGQFTSEADFDRDIRETLKERLVELKPGEVLSRGSGKRYVFRQVALGKSSEREMQWTYYLCADPSGRQVSFSFACERDTAESLSTAMEQMVNSLRFVPTR